MKFDAIMVDRKDNVATALRDIKAHESCCVATGGEPQSISLIEPIPYGHKFAVLDIEKGTDIIKYGEVMGRATAFIPRGTHAHIQNIESLRGRGDLEKKGE